MKRIERFVCLLAILTTTCAFGESPWVRTTDTDKMTGAVHIIYSVAPISSQGSTNSRNPNLSIICQNRRFKFIDYWVGDVVATDRIGDDVSKSMIQYRIDDKRMRIEWWNDNMRHVFSQSANFKELLAANKLILRVSTFTGDVITDEFNVAGLDTPQFHEDCGK